MSTIGRNASWHFVTFFQTVRNFSPNFTCLLIFLFSYLKLWRSYAILSATTQSAFRSMVGILSTLWWSRLIWHNFLKVAVNWIKICSPAYIGTYNSKVKFGLKNSQPFGKNERKFQGWDFFDSHCSCFNRQQQACRTLILFHEKFTYCQRS